MQFLLKFIFFKKVRLSTFVNVGKWNCFLRIEKNSKLFVRWSLALHFPEQIAYSFIKAIQFFYSLYVITKQNATYSIVTRIMQVSIALIVFHATRFMTEITDVLYEYEISSTTGDRIRNHSITAMSDLISILI